MPAQSVNHLIKLSEKILTVNQNEDGFEDVTSSITSVDTPTKTEFETHGFNNVGVLFEDRTQKVVLSTYHSDVEDGKLYKTTFTREDFPVIENIDVDV